MMILALAVAASMAADPGATSCAAWTELRHIPPSAAVIEAWVIGHVDAFNETELKKPPYLDPGAALKKLDADCANGKGSIASELFIEEAAFDLSRSNPPRP